ncbi:PREDICTED: nose resistant to fluoxetine protein 6 isoform X1 [Drosophila arizonae]|uniref:Nose resistant to fluoxetine protein 6 isoform X1 n=2 Tax=Drosophila arizonae TaxID=7263 RepID=A0ABM1PDV7_DROAR|nr:PREDICTED: nose resistant to fluoxetine protein 6 isoform X1 [Drosophila arizonae]XP_017865392.1 PREDICTED: nose resistant to fluoxetine protein 6 isoform X1 [Drosophila arizonae]XP_017865393.1 PREDICTED: nose resistant to fluoxetine protein 6 isoform X1 [Drosophila arizonae]
MPRYGYGIASTALWLSLLLGSCVGIQNESTLQLQTFDHAILNGSNIWSNKDLEVTVTANANEVENDDDGAKTDRHEALLAQSSIIYGLTEVANASNVNPICHAQLKHVQRSILNKQPWALKVLDASGGKPSGFIFGQNYWLGSREACGSMQRPLGITLSKQYKRQMHNGLITQQSPFDMDYRVIYLRHNSPWQVELKLMSEQIIHIGLCLPSSCKSSEIQQLTSDYMAGSFKDSDIFEMQPEVLYVKDLKLRDVFYNRLSFKLVVGFVLATCAFMLCAQQLSVAKQLPADGHVDGAGLAPVESEIWRALHFLLKWRPVQSFVSCYDVANNWRRIVATRENSSSEIPLLNGLRSVCAVGILIFHVMWFMYFTVHNKATLLAYGEQIFFQYISSAPLLVDVFFTISGFLQTYNFLRNTKQLQAIRDNGSIANVKLFCKLLFHRYLRLVPLYLIVMGSVDLVFAYIGDTSVYHINERFDEICSQHWWRNLLFIQNFYDFNDLCLNWSWSMACDMQFFLIANAILFLYVKHPKSAKLLTLAGLVANIVWSFGIGIKSNFEFSFDIVYGTSSQIYINPIVRVLPYIVGSIVAFCLAERRVSYQLSEGQQRWLWHFCLLVFVICIHSTIKRDLGYMITIVLFALGRICFSLSVCWMIVGSATGRGVWWSRLLEARCFQHLNRVSYAFYLLNPLIISLIYGLSSSSTHADPIMLCIICCGFTLIVYLASIVFSMAFELPYSNLSSLLLRKPKTT